MSQGAVDFDAMTSTGAQSPKNPRERTRRVKAPLFHVTSRLLGFALQGALQRLIEGGLGFLVFGLRDLALAALDFELEEFFFQGIEQDGGRAGCRGRRGAVRCENISRGIVVLFLKGCGSGSFLAGQLPRGGLLPRSHIDSADYKDRG